MNQPETRPILYEIECPLCHGEFTERFTPEQPITDEEISNAQMIKKTRACPLCKKDITYELPAVLLPTEQVVREMGEG